MRRQFTIVIASERVDMGAFGRTLREIAPDIQVCSIEKTSELTDLIDPQNEQESSEGKRLLVVDFDHPHLDLADLVPRFRSRSAGSTTRVIVVLPVFTAKQIDSSYALNAAGMAFTPQDTYGLTAFAEFFVSYMESWKQHTDSFAVAAYRVERGEEEILICGKGSGAPLAVTEGTKDHEADFWESKKDLQAASLYVAGDGP